MENLKSSEIKILEQEFGPVNQAKLNLYIILGLLGDFDSFEYIQSLVLILDKLKDYGFNIFVLGIGDAQSKKYFCNHTKLPKSFLKVIESNSIHKQLGLNEGLSFSNSQIFNLMLMCMGIGSKGTLREVLRGYTGDINGQRIFKSDKDLPFIKNNLFNYDLFNLIGNNDSLRPFELASLRLINMKEVLSNWKIYMLNNDYLTQRGATYVIDADYKFIYSHKNEGVLGFSENMSNPMRFLYNIMNDQ